MATACVELPEESKPLAEDISDDLKGKQVDTDGIVGLTENVEEMKLSGKKLPLSETVIRSEIADLDGKLVQRGIVGFVKKFNSQGYGFIERLDNHKDVFCHMSNVLRSQPDRYYKLLYHGQKVEFDVCIGAKGLEAIGVTGVGGTSVKGTRVHIHKRRPLRRAPFPSGRAGPPRPNGDQEQYERKNGQQPMGRNRRRYTSEGKTEGSGEEQLEEQTVQKATKARGRVFRNGKNRKGKKAVSDEKVVKPAEEGAPVAVEDNPKPEKDDISEKIAPSEAQADEKAEA